MSKANKYRVVITEPISLEAIDFLRGDFDVVVLNGRSSELTIDCLADSDAIIVRNLEISREVISKARRLHCIIKHGTGVDNIDVAAASERKILVANVPGVNASAVAEATIALILATVRRVPYVHGLVMAGRYSERWSLEFASVFGANLGLIGCGAVGSRVGTACARGFDMTVYVYDPGKPAEELAQFGFVKVPDKNELLSLVDIVSIHATLRENNHHMIGEKELRAMRRQAILINTARGALIDQAALVRALDEGWISGAGLDVFEKEPPDVDDRLLQFPNVVLSPHTSPNTTDMARLIGMSAAKTLKQIFAGELPSSVINRHETRSGLGRIASHRSGRRPER